MWDGLHIGSPGHALFPKGHFQDGLGPSGYQMMSVPHSVVVLISADVGGGALLVSAMLAHLIQECWRPTHQTMTFWSPTGGLGSSLQNATMERERWGRLCLYVGRRAF